MKKTLFLAACLALAGTANAQLSSNPDKFLGNITTRGSVNGGGIEYATLWNQITPENESKWASIEGNRNSYNWGGCDNAYNYAKNHKFPFKFHTLVWGSQYPKWMDSLSKEEQLKEITEWMDQVKKRYPNLDMIDVVNEAVSGHAPAPYKEALGGDGVTGYDWIIKAFEMAAERWPDAILIYNDYNTFQWQKDQFKTLVKTIRDAGAPIDAYGCQSHDLTDMSFSAFQSAMTDIQNTLKMPMYSTEYDIGTTDDAKQKTQYMNQIKYMWERDYVAGITLWGYIYGATWTTDGNSGIIKNGVDRPAMTWLREYMASEAAQKAKSPFPGMKKEASLYIKPRGINISLKDEAKIKIEARLRTKQVEKLEFYVSGQLVSTMTEAPFVVRYTPTTSGSKTLKAILYDTEGNKYERTQTVNVVRARTAFKNTPTVLPGVLEIENFDSGYDGIAFHDSNSTKQGNASSYRTDATGIDLIKIGTDGYGVGYTNNGEWMEYTLDVQEAGLYEYDVVASSSVSNAAISLSLSDDGDLTPLTGNIIVPNMGDGNLQTLHGRLALPLEAGKNVIRISTLSEGLSLDKVVFKHVDVNNDIDIAVNVDPESVTVEDPTTLSATVSCGSAAISKVDFYVNGLLAGSVASDPFEVTYTPDVAGTMNVTAVATDANGKVSVEAQKAVKVERKRSPFAGTPVEIPGTVEFENFDKGGDGLSFHDSDAKDEGGTNYRKDNEGVDIVAGNGGYAIGYTAVDEWYDYSIDVKYPGRYAYEAVVSSGADNSSFQMYIVKDGVETKYTPVIDVPNGGSWDSYTTVSKNFPTSRKFTEGKQILRIKITGASCNLDKVKLICLEENTGIEQSVELSPVTYAVFTVSGSFVGKVQANGSSEIKKKILAITGQPDIYVIRNTETNEAIKIEVK